MTAPRDSHDRRRGVTVLVALVVLAAGTTACSLLLDRNARQCQTSDDCSKRFPEHPQCSNGVCVSSGLGPPGCFFGTPQSSKDFLNACTLSPCLPAPDCLMEGHCIEAGAALIPPVVPDAGAPADAGSPSDAGAIQLPSCVDPVDRPQVIYITGSSNFPPLLAKLGPLVTRNSGYTPVYQVTSSCNGVKSMFSTTNKDHFITDPLPTNKTVPATYVSADGTLVPCSLGPTGSGGARVDIGESDIFATSCPASGSPNADIHEYFGPIQAMLFVVPSTSSQTVISAAMARSIFGLGGAHGITLPWIKPELYFVRNANTGTQQMMGRAIDVPAEQFWGADRSSAKNVASLLIVLAAGGGNNAEQSIGLLSNDFYDSNRGNLSALSFQAFEQSCGYLPDSTAFVKDKRNVRDGHYPIWGPLHFFAATSQGIPSAAAQAFLSVVTEPEPEQDLLDAYIDAGLVPNCAMNVIRTTDLGALTAYTPAAPCACYFENRVKNPMGAGAPPAGCRTCTTAAECPDSGFPACRNGFCEAKGNPSP